MEVTVEVGAASAPATDSGLTPSASAWRAALESRAGRAMERVHVAPSAVARRSNLALGARWSARLFESGRRGDASASQ